MIVLDTHVWIWWVQGDERLTAKQRQAIQDNEEDGLGVCAISCWEIAKLVEKGRLVLPVGIEEWFELALSYPGIELIPISPAIAVASTRFPGDFSQDPADQLIAATASILDCPLITSDAKLLGHPQLTTVY
jgi:PIN domain nuclease of toxin-antitoxin system